MVSDEQYELCLPILWDDALHDEEKTDKLEEILRRQTNLTGSSLENTILDAMWRWRENGTSSESPPTLRHSILRRSSPASWRGSPTIPASPRLGVSPLAPVGYVPSALQRAKSSTASPFSSPRASPRLALATPVLPLSPSLHAYEFTNDPTPAPEILGDFQAENVEWLVNDDTNASQSSAGTTSSLNASAPAFSSMSSQQTEMSPYDMLRSVLGESRTDEEIEAALALHSYDIGATLASLMGGQGQESNNAGAFKEGAKNVLVGRSLSTNEERPATPSSQQKSTVVCKFFMSTGQCLRADCRYSHDPENFVCKYWMTGQCLAGDTCLFSHDPSLFMNKLSFDETDAALPQAQANIQLHDANAFPSLQGNGSNAAASPVLRPVGRIPPAAPRNFSGLESPRGRSRPTSSQQNKDMMSSAPSIDDNEAFPSLGSALVKQGKRHHGKRGGHGHGQRENLVPSSLADIIKRTPSPAPALSRPDSKKSGLNGSAASFRHGENNAAAQAIPAPRHIPWLETGDRANKAYLSARQDAIKHGGLRNKFLQSAAQAWNRNDARAAKILSLRGQGENDLMRQAHRRAALELYELHNKRNAGTAPEIFVDLHGLHSGEAIEYLEKILMENSQEARPVYAIVGTGHHSKNGKDKVSKAVRGFLNECRYSFREFSVPGDRNNMGGILGINPRSWDKSLLRESGGGGGSEDSKAGTDILSQGVEIGDGKVRLLVRDPPRGPSSRRR